MRTETTQIELPEDLRTPELIQAWADYVEHRRIKRAKMTQRAADLHFKDMRAWGHRKAVLALQNSVKNGWTGVFEPDEKKSKQVPKQVNGAGRIYESDPATRAKLARETAIVKLFDAMDPTEQDCLLAEYRRLSPKNEFASHVHRAFREWAYDTKRGEAV